MYVDLLNSSSELSLQCLSAPMTGFSEYSPPQSEYFPK